MGKKRSSLARLNKVYTTASSSSAASSNSSLSVSDKLSKLRLEGLRHERNIAGISTRNAASTSHNASSLQVTPDVSQLLGQTHVAPESRAKPRNRGHLAPKSWSKPTSQKRTNQVLTRVVPGLHAGNTSLIDLCLYHIMHDIHAYTNLGMNFLPGPIKARLLASLASPTKDAIWSDLLPEEDEDIYEIDLTLTRPNLKCLKRLPGLRSVSLTIAQVESSIVPALPSVMRELTIIAATETLPTGNAQKAYWRRLSSHFIALKCIKLDLQHLVLDQEGGLDNLLQNLLEGPDWREAFDTVDQIVFLVGNDVDAKYMVNSLLYVCFKGSLRKLRRMGRHVECSIILRGEQHEHLVEES